MDCRGEQTADRSHVPGTASIVLSSQTGPESGRTASGPLLSIRRRKPERTPAGRFACKLALCGSGTIARSEITRPWLVDSAEPFAPFFLRDRRRHRRWGSSHGSSRARSTKRTLRKLPEQESGQDHSPCCNRIRIMPLGPYAATRAGGSPALARGKQIQDDRRGQRGKTAPLGYQLGSITGERIDTVESS